MNEVPLQTYLTQRKSTYYFRMRVPLDIAKIYGKREICISLKTKEYAEAIRAVRLKAAEVEQEFSLCRHKLALQSEPLSDKVTPDYLETIKTEVYRRALSDDETFKVLGVVDPTSPNNTIYYKDNHESHIASLEASLKFARELYAKGDADAYMDKAIDWLAASPEQRNAPEVRQVARVIQEAFISAQEAILERSKGTIIPTPKTERSIHPNSYASSSNGFPLLSIVLGEWIEDKSRADWKGEKTPREHRVWVEAFISLIGDKPCNEYTKADARAFRELLFKLPPNWRNSTKYRRMSIAEAADAAHKQNIPPMNPRTAKKIFGFVSSLWSWLIANYDIEKNIFEGLTISVRTNKRDEKLPFTASDLIAIFSGTIYKGCLSERKVFTRGNYSLANTAKYWAPLISIYSGMRLNEILQLHLSDIKKDGGVYYFDVNDQDDNKTTKTSSSNRLIPIHTQLIKLGLLELVIKQQEARTTRLFSEVPLSSDGTYSDGYSKFFTRYLEALEIKRSKISFHSFRHCFTDACREADMPREIRMELMGHSDDTMSGRYGAGHSLNKLNEWLQKIEYSGLEETLSHLEKQTDTK